MFGALKRGFRSMASLILVSNVVGELQPKRTLAASRGFLAAARLSCITKILGRIMPDIGYWCIFHKQTLIFMDSCIYKTQKQMSVIIY